MRESTLLEGEKREDGKEGEKAREQLIEIEKKEEAR